MPPLSYLPEWGLVKFKQVTVNEGDAFGLASGNFIAPKKGLYHFSFFALVIKDSLWCAIGSHESKMVFAEGGHNGDHDAGLSISVNFALETGQTVNAMCMNKVEAPAEIVGDNDPDRLRHFHFSGHLIAAL